MATEYEIIETNATAVYEVVEAAVGVKGDPGATGAPGTTTWAGITDKPSTFPPSAHTHPTSEVTGLDAALAATASATALTAEATARAAADTTEATARASADTAEATARASADATLTTAVAARIPTTEKGAASGVATLDSGGKVPSTQLPALAITDTFVIASQAAMLASAAETGDVAVRTDLSKSFILRGSNPTVLADWQELATPPGGVTSFNGRTGTVSPTSGDYGTGDITGLTGALAGKVDTTDARLTDARTPTAHASSHASGGSDPLTPASIGAATAAALTTETTARTDADAAEAATRATADSALDGRLDALEGVAPLTATAPITLTSGAIGLETTVTGGLAPDRLAGDDFTTYADLTAFLTAPVYAAYSGVIPEVPFFDSTLPIRGQRTARTSAGSGLLRIRPRVAPGATTYWTRSSVRFSDDFVPTGTLWIANLYVGAGGYSFDFGFSIASGTPDRLLAVDSIAGTSTDVGPVSDLVGGVCEFAVSVTETATDVFRGDFYLALPGAPWRLVATSTATPGDLAPPDHIVALTHLEPATGQVAVGLWDVVEDVADPYGVLAPTVYTATATDERVGTEATIRATADSALDVRVDALEVAGYATTAALTAVEDASIAADAALDTRIDALETAPPAHASSHHTGGTDPIAPADIGAAPALARGTVSHTTASLANGASESSTFPTSKSALLLRVTTSAAARVRLYRTSAARTTDATRPAGTLPLSGSGVLSDTNLVPGGVNVVALGGGAYQIVLSPVPNLANGDSPAAAAIYAAITNASGGTTAITVDLITIPLES